MIIDYIQPTNTGEYPHRIVFDTKEIASFYEGKGEIHIHLRSGHYFALYMDETRSFADNLKSCMSQPF